MFTSTCRPHGACGVVLLVACATSGGCGSDSGIPVISSTVTGQFGDVTFKGELGFALERKDRGLIGLGEGPLNCDTVNDTDPPSGNNATIRPPSLEVGSYSGVSVMIYHNEGSFRGKGSTGTLEITASDAESVAGSISFTLTDDGETYALNGDFEVQRCR